MKKIETAAKAASMVGGAAAAFPAASAAFSAGIPLAIAVPAAPVVFFLTTLAVGAFAGPAAVDGLASFLGSKR
jgi:hypothetical protein